MNCIKKSKVGENIIDAMPPKCEIIILHSTINFSNIAIDIYFPLIFTIALRLKKIDSWKSDEDQY